MDRILFWTAVDLNMKLLELQRYCQGHRTPAGAGRVREGAELGAGGSHRPRQPGGTVAKYTSDFCSDRGRSIDTAICNAES